MTVAPLPPPADGMLFFFFSSRRRHTRFDCDWSSDVCSSDLPSPDRRLAAATACHPFCKDRSPPPRSCRVRQRRLFRLCRDSLRKATQESCRHSTDPPQTTPRFWCISRCPSFLRLLNGEAHGPELVVHARCAWRQPATDDRERDDIHQCSEAAEGPSTPNVRYGGGGGDAVRRTAGTGTRRRPARAAPAAGPRRRGG